MIRTHLCITSYYYFRRLNRTVKALGIHPYVFYVLAVPVFILISKLSFDKSDLVCLKLY